MDSLCSALRIANKYAMEAVREWCIGLLLEALPGDSVSRAPITLNLYAREPTRAAEIIAIGQTCHVPQLLPLAFYCLATSATEDVGTRYREFPQDCDTLIALSIGKDRLKGLWRDYVRCAKDLCTYPDPIGYCENKTQLDVKCEVGRRTKANARQEAILIGATDPLRYLFRSMTGVSTMCKSCHAEHMDQLRAHSTRIFQALPAIFGMYVTCIFPYRATTNSSLIIPLSVTHFVDSVKDVEERPIRAIHGRLLSVTNNLFTNI